VPPFLVPFSVPCRPAPEVVTPAVRCGKIGQGSDFVVSADTSSGTSFDKGGYQKTEGKLVAGLLLVLKKRNDIITTSQKCNMTESECLMCQISFGQVFFQP